MNLLIVILVILLLWRAVKGFKNGFAHEINTLVSTFMALTVLSLVLLLVASIVEKNTRTIIISAVILILAGLLYRLVGVVMKSLETIAKLPIINLINKLFGMGAGVLEVLVIFWIVYVIIESFPTGAFGEQIMSWTAQSEILTNIYQKNYIAKWITGLKI